MIIMYIYTSICQFVRKFKCFSVLFVILFVATLFVQLNGQSLLRALSKNQTFSTFSTGKELCPQKVALS